MLSLHVTVQKDVGSEVVRLVDGRTSSRCVAMVDRVLIEAYEDSIGSGC